MSEDGYVQPDYSLLGPDHVAAYQESDGEVGYIWNGVPTLLLTHTGRVSGKAHTTPLIFAADGEDYVVVASMGGAPVHPQWYLNLEANPTARVQVRADHVDVHARVAEGDERRRLWDLVCAAWPNYNAYQSRTERVIPVVVLSPAGG
ncbi:MAG TPA: nitroreductase family deazaflavin-dependent oxidoreductase [Mycobacteriales bacterium]|nr:nitroreductase family deazaflavin-dependent oxidoreductase [Mycobacteriales bacterium]